MRRAHGFEKTTPPARLTPTHLPLHRGGNRTRQHRTTLAPLRKGSSRRSRLRGRFFSGARTLLPIRLLRCPDRSLTAKPAQRATDGRPYELKSVPTKTVAIRTSGNCAILVQNLVCTLAFPLRGRCRRSRRMRCFFNSGFTFYLYFYCVGPTGDSGKTGTAGDRWSPLRIGLSAGRAFAPCLREAAHLRFSPQLRYRATAISVSVGAEVRL